MSFSARSAELASGVTIPYVGQGDRDGIPVLLVHAIADSWRAFEPILPHLPPSIRAFAMSQRGHGDAGRPASGYRPEDFADDLAAFMDRLELDRAVLVGASSGGVVARRFAIDHPDRTLGLVLLGAPLRLGDNPAVKEMWDSTFSTLTDPIDEAVVRDFAAATIAPSVPRAFVETVVAESLKAPAHVWRETMRGLIEDASADELGRIEAPTLVVWGDEDPILARLDQEAMAAAIPNATLAVYEGGGHAFYWETPERVASDLTRFVETISLRRFEGRRPGQPTT